MGRWIVVCRPGMELTAWFTVALAGHEVAAVQASPNWVSDDFLLIPEDQPFPLPPFTLEEP